MRKLLSSALLPLLLIPAFVFGQDSPSLGDVARQYQARKTALNSASAGSSVKAQSPARSEDNIEVSKLDPTDYIAYVQKLLREDKFDELDRLAASERSGKTRFAGGGWRLFTLYIGLDKPEAEDAPDADWQAQIEKLQRWQSFKPQSITPRVALAEAYLGYAWKARGHEYADKVTVEGWTLFAARVQTAKKILVQAWDLKEKCPHWYRAMQTVALADGWGKEEEAALLQQAVFFAPDYYYFYQAHARYLLPKWNGEEGEVEKFAEDTANQIGGSRGDTVYYRIADELSCDCGEDESPKLSWPRIQKGYAAIKEQYGETQRSMNKLALLAFHFKDAKAADGMFTVIGDRWDKGVWGSQHYFESSKEWAWSEANAASRAQYISQVDSEFRKKYALVVSRCETEAGIDPASIASVFLQLGATGAVEQVMAAPSIKDCLAQKLQAAVFSPPPRAHFALMIDMNRTP